MDVHLDVEAVERAEASLDAFINSRSKAKEKANAEEDLWRASERRVREKRRRANRQAWIEHHGLMHRLHSDLASDHADRRSRLMAEGGYELGDGLEERGVADVS